MGTCWADYELWSRRVESILRKLGRTPPGTVFDDAAHWSPPTDVFETENGVVVKMEVPGIQAADLSIALVDDRLLVKGSRTDPHAGCKTQYHQMEISYGVFAKIVVIRTGFQRDGIRAALQDGFLSITIPRAIDPAPVRVALEITCD